MADENDLNEKSLDFLQAMQTVMDAMRRGVTPPVEALNVLANAARQASKEQEEASKAVKAAGAAFRDQIFSFGASLGRGKTELASMSSVLKTATGYITSLAKASKNPAAIAAAKTLEVAAEGAAYGMERSEAAFQSFQELARVGGVGADGLLGLAESFTTAGMTLKQFESMVAQNSRSLAGLYGSADTGAAEIAKAMSTMRGGLDQELRRIGFTTEEVADTMVAYADLQRAMGQQQQLSQAQLTLGTQQYGKELDELAKLTGMSRKEQVKQMEAANRNTRFLAKIQQMQASGQAKQAEELYKLNNIYASVSPELAAAFQDQVSGYLTSDAAIKGNISSNYAMLRSTQAVIAGQTDAVGAFKDVQGGINEVIPQVRTFGAAMGDTGPYSNLLDLTKAASLGMGDIADIAAKNKETQDKQTKGSSESVELMIDASRKLSDAASTLDSITVSFSTIRDVMQGIASASKEATELLARSKTEIQQMFGSTEYVPIAGEGYGGTPETEIKVSPTPEMAEMKALDVKRNELLDAIRTGLPDEFASDEEIAAWQDLKTQLEGVNTRLDELKDITAAQTKAAQDAYLTPVSKIIDEAIKASGKPIGSASMLEALKGTEFGGFGSAYNLSVGPEKAKEMRDMITAAGGIFGPDGTVNVGLMDSLKNIVKRSNSATTVPVPNSAQMSAPAPSMAKGGIATGPRSGYQATLHGTEAVVPLEGQKIPVEIKDTRDMRPQMDLMERQIAKLDAVIDAIQKHTAVSEKIFRTNYS